MGTKEVGAVAEELMFDHERLDVYRVAREVADAVAGFLKPSVSRELRDQIERASTSIVFNIAEGAGKTSQAEKRRFYAIARGSSTELAAQLDILRIRGLITAQQYGHARGLLLRTVQMLSRMAGTPRHN